LHAVRQQARGPASQTSARLAERAAGGQFHTAARFLHEKFRKPRCWFRPPSATVVTTRVGRRKQRRGRGRSAPTTDRDWCWDKPQRLDVAERSRIDRGTARPSAQRRVSR
jgi:hypothetical protein